MTIVTLGKTQKMVLLVLLWSTTVEGRPCQNIFPPEGKGGSNDIGRACSQQCTCNKQYTCITDRGGENRKPNWETKGQKEDDDDDFWSNPLTPEQREEPIAIFAKYPMKWEIEEGYCTEVRQ